MYDTTYPFDAWLAEGMDADYDKYDEDYEAVRASPFGTTEKERYDFNHDDQGNLVPVCCVHDERMRWDPDYWRAEYEQAMQ